MALNINLLRKTQTISPALLNIAKIVQRVAIVLLSVFILVTILVFAIRIFFTVETNQIQNKINTATQQIQAEKSTEGVYLSYLQKLSAIDTAAKDRFQAPDIINKIKKALPPQATISAVSLNKENFLLGVEFASLETLQSVISGLQNQTELPVKEFTLQGFDKNLKGKYITQFQIVMGQNKK